MPQSSVNFEEKTQDLLPVSGDRKIRSIDSVIGFIAQQAEKDRNRKANYDILPELKIAKDLWAAFDDKAFAKKQSKSQKIEAANKALDAIKAQFKGDVELQGFDLAAFNKGGIFRNYLIKNIERADFPIFMSDFIHYASQLANPALTIEEKKARLLEFPIHAELNCFEGTRERLNLSLQKLALKGMNYEEQKLLRAHSDVIEKARQNFSPHVFVGNQIHLLSAVAWIAGFEDKQLHFNKTTSFEVPAEKAWKFFCDYTKALNAELDRIRKDDIAEFGKYRDKNLSLSEVSDLELLLKEKDLEGEFLTYNGQAYLPNYDEENFARLVQGRGFSESDSLIIRQFLMDPNSEELSENIEPYGLVTNDLEEGKVLIANPEYGKARLISGKIDQISALVVDDAIDYSLLPTSLFDADVPQKIAHLVHSGDANLQKIALKALLMMGREVQSGRSAIQFYNCMVAISFKEDQQIIYQKEKFLKHFTATEELQENAKVVIATMKEQQLRYPQHKQSFFDHAAVVKKDLVLEMLVGNANFAQIKDHIAALDVDDLREVIKRFSSRTDSAVANNFLHNPDRFLILDALLNGNFKANNEANVRTLGFNLGCTALLNGDLQMMKYIKQGFSLTTEEELKGGETARWKNYDEAFGTLIINRILSDKGVSEFCRVFGAEKLAEIVNGAYLFTILNNEPKSQRHTSNAALVNIARSKDSKSFTEIIKLISADGRDISEFVNKEINDSGFTLGHFVARYGTAEMINCLNEVGVDFSKKRVFRGIENTAAHEAAACGNIQTAKALEAIDPKLFIKRTFDGFGYIAPYCRSVNNTDESSLFNDRIKSYGKIYAIAHELTSTIRKSFGEKATTLLGAESKAAISKIEDKIFDFLVEKFGVDHKEAALQLGYSNTKKGVFFTDPLSASLQEQLKACVTCEPQPYCCGMMTKYEYTATRNLATLINPLLPVAQICATRPSDSSERKEEEEKVQTAFAPNKTPSSPVSNKMVSIPLANEI